MNLKTARHPLDDSRRRTMASGLVTLQWIAILAVMLLGIAVVWLYARNQQQQTELQEARRDLATLSQLREQLAELEPLRAKASQVESLEKDQAELVRLRGEVAALRPLKQQVQGLEAEKQQLRQSVQSLKQQTSELSTVKNQNQQLQGALAQQMQADQVRACVANLRAIQGAKATWALEHRKTEAETPTEADLFGADKYILAVPKCPAGGTYTLGPVNQKSACSIAGHAF